MFVAFIGLAALVAFVHLGFRLTGDADRRRSLSGRGVDE